jgi:FixJ family two-component response regulator
VPAIFATGCGADIKLLMQARQQGLPILQKPYSPRDLARTVRETLDQHRLVATKQASRFELTLFLRVCYWEHIRGLRHLCRIAGP